MYSSATKSLLICGLSAAFLAGCASNPTESSKPMASSGTSTPTAMTGASSQGTVQSGKVIDISRVGSTDQSTAMSSSGSSMSGASASGATATAGTPAVITVLFDNGTQARYAVDQQPEIPFATGDAVKVISDKDGITIFSP